MGPCRLNQPCWLTTSGALPDHVRVVVRARVHQGASNTLAVADAQSDELWLSNVPPGWSAGYNADLHRLRAQEFSRVVDAIYTGVDVDTIICGGADGGGEA